MNFSNAESRIQAALDAQGGPGLSIGLVQNGELAWYGGKAEELYDARTPARGTWHEGAEWPWPQAQSEAFLEVAMRRLAASGRRPSRSLRLLT